jgi:hypothetical protein
MESDGVDRTRQETLCPSSRCSWIFWGRDHFSQCPVIGDNSGGLATFYRVVRFYVSYDSNLLVLLSGSLGRRGSRKTN